MPPRLMKPNAPAVESVIELPRGSHRPEQEEEEGSSPLSRRMLALRGLPDGLPEGAVKIVFPMEML